MQSPSREEILSRIRDALGSSASASLRPDSEKASESDLLKTVCRIRETSRENRQSLIDRFENELIRVGGTFRRCESREAASSYICELAKSKGTNRAVGWNSDRIDQPEIIASLKNAGIEFTGDSDGVQREEFIASAIDAGLGISGVDYALADTGTLVLISGESKARSASLLPPVHIALVMPDQFLSGLDDLFPLLRFDLDVDNRNLSSAVTFITGPSRTADIELTLVVGVHGPQELHVILLELE